MESRPQNSEFRINPENFQPCKCAQYMSGGMRFPKRGMCDQQSLRSAFAYAQSDLSLC